MEKDANRDTEDMGPSKQLGQGYAEVGPVKVATVFAFI